MTFLIDGHNLLWAVKKLDCNAQGIAEIRLCFIIDRFLRLTRRKGWIVFDGTGPQDKNAFQDLTNLGVSFAGAATDADTVVEKKIEASTSPKVLTVVSSDHRLQKAAHRRKAAAMKSEAFWDELCLELKRRQTPKEPLQKRLGLTDAETEHWLKIFGLQ